MLKQAIGVVVVLAAAVAAIWHYSPGLRTKMSHAWNEQTGWTEQARRADPVGFVNHAEKKMKEDLTAMQKTRRELAAEVGTLVRKTREQRALAEQSRAMADEFRQAYQAASPNGSFPIELRGEAYTEPQIRSQVSLLLAEAEGYEQSLAEIESVQTEAEQRMEDLAVRIGKTESQLAALSTKRELLRARELTTEGEQLLAQVDQLMTGNTQAIAGNPVRTVRELAAAEQKPAGRANAAKVEAFLAAKPSELASPHRPADLPLEDGSEAITTSFLDGRGQEAETESVNGKPPKQQKCKRGKPIFQQS